jgi:outer membrane protein TolC
LPFGQANVYRLGLSFSQALYAGGRIAASEEQARLRRDSASLGVTSTRAQATLDVAQAYYDAALADRLVSIAEQTYNQADQALQQATAQRDAGRLSEFEQLRARVARDTLQPDVVRTRANRDVAYLHLKQLLDFPAEQPLSLVADLDDSVLPAPARFASRLANLEAPAAAPERIAVTQAAQDVGVATASVRAAVGERRPAVAFRSDYGLVSYPGNVPSFNDWRTNWTLGVGVTMPILTGGRLRADEAAARAGVTESAARLKLAKELSALDNHTVRLQLLAAHANWQAIGATIEQAARAYEIADLRFREGLSTQLELSDARLLLARAQVTRALAARDLQVQRVQFALLPELPLGGLSISASGGGVATANTQGAAAATQPTAGTAAGATAVGRTAAQGGQ